MDFSELVWADRSGRTKLRFTDEQRAWFLHQVLTQAFEDMRPGEARDTCMITVHGRMVAFAEAVSTGDAILLHAEPELRAPLHEGLVKHVFSTRVDIADLTDDMGLVLVAGPGLDEALEDVDLPVVRHPTASLGTPAEYLWVRRADVENVLRGLDKAGGRPATEEELEAVRIANGVPRWGHEMTPKTFPQEAGIDARAVHYDKGCYLGQEAMAKIHFRGKVNRRKVRLRGEGALAAGADVTLDGARAGAVTSAHGKRGIALVRHTVEPGARVDAAGIPAEVLD